MPVLNSLTQSTKNGWKLITSNLLLSIYSIVSIAYIFLLGTNYSLIAEVIGISDNLYFIVPLSLFTVIFLFVGAAYNKNYHRQLNLICNAVGIAFPLLLLLEVKGIPGLLGYTFLGGISAAMCLPNVISAFLSKTDYNNRGSACGIFTFIVFVVIIALSFIIDSFIALVLALVILKALGFLASINIKSIDFSTEELVYTKTSIKTKIAFLVVWTIFNVVDVVVATILSSTVNASQIQNTIIESRAIGLVAMVVAGAIMDNYGRKRIMIFAYAYLGLDYAMISLAGNSLYQLTVLDGIAWGILTILLLLILWGDTCKPTSRGIWIAASLSIAFSLQILTLIMPSLLKGLTNEQIFPLTSIFLFVAVVIILALPETIPDRFLQKKELEDYIQQVKKVSEKYKK
jgi:MFS family permease